MCSWKEIARALSSSPPPLSLSLYIANIITIYSLQISKEILKIIISFTNHSIFRSSVEVRTRDFRAGNSLTLSFRVTRELTRKTDSITWARMIANETWIDLRVLSCPIKKYKAQVLFKCGNKTECRNNWLK